MENTLPPNLPSLPSVEEWKRQTDLKFLGFTKPRSADLKALDTALGAYEVIRNRSQRNPATDTLQQQAKHALKTVDQCFQQWERGGRYLDTTGSGASRDKGSGRNSQGAVRALRDALDAGMERFSPDAPAARPRPAPRGTNTLGSKTRNSVLYLREQRRSNNAGREALGSSSATPQRNPKRVAQIVGTYGSSSTPDVRKTSDEPKPGRRRL
jgi:hypothetical protein